MKKRCDEVKTAEDGIRLLLSRPFGLYHYMKAIEASDAKEYSPLYQRLKASNAIEECPRRKRPYIRSFLALCGLVVFVLGMAALVFGI